MCLTASFAVERSKLRDTSQVPSERANDLAYEFAVADADELIAAMGREKSAATKDAEAPRG
jgi:hypothetical protein